MQPRIVQFTVSIGIGDDTLDLIRQIIKGIGEKGPFGRPVSIASLGTVKETDNPLLLTGGEAAKQLKICEKTLKTLARAGKAPKPIRFGRSVRWNAEELRAWLAAGGPNAEGGKDARGTH